MKSCFDTGTDSKTLRLNEADEWIDISGYHSPNRCAGASELRIICGSGRTLNQNMPLIQSQFLKLLDLDQGRDRQEFFQDGQEGIFWISKGGQRPYFCAFSSLYMVTPPTPPTPLTTAFSANVTSVC